MKNSNNWIYYEVGDGSGEFSHHFVMSRQNIAVTEDVISINYYCWKIELSVKEKTFDFYRDFYPAALKDFYVSIDS